MRNIKIKSEGVPTSEIMKRYPIGKSFVFDTEYFMMYGFYSRLTNVSKVMDVQVANYYYKVGSRKKLIVGIVFRIPPDKVKEFCIRRCYGCRIPPVTTKSSKLFYPLEEDDPYLFAIHPSEIHRSIKGPSSINPFIQFLSRS